MIEELEKRAEEYEGSVIDYAAQWLGSGRTMLELAGDLSDAIKNGSDSVTRYMLSRYLQSLPGGAEAIEEASREGGASMADRALDIADEDVEDKTAVARNKLRSDARFKMAGYMNPAFKDQKGTNVTISLPGLHLDALRLRALPDMEQLTAGEEIAQVEGADAEQA